MRIAIAWLAVVCLCGYFEVQRFFAASETPAGPLAWFGDWDPETTLPLLVLCLLPLLCLFSGERPPEPGHPSSEQSSAVFRVGGCVLVFVVSLACSAWMGFQPVRLNDGMRSVDEWFVDLPPAYHDEYSYLLQAETFADGRLSWPAVPVRPDLFHQYHVLNEHRTASRYFPWTGAWIALFLETGRPVVGHWLAGALAAVFFFLSAIQMLRPKPALVAGMLIAVSPGLAVFSNLLLAHHPTMLALSLFLWAMLHLLMTPSVLWSIVAGIGLSLAMLGRPMTAAAFGLPWGLVFVWCWLRPPSDHWAAKRHRLVLAMATPLVAGFGVLALLNHEITGSYSRTAYQKYTDTYTPRHTYGFNNGVRGDAMQTPKVLTDYDQWATNLTWPVAIRNVGLRCLASAQWTLGIVPITFGLVLAIMRVIWSNEETAERTLGMRLILASVVSLHVAHIPYWFDGIMHWHYVFETAPLLLILVAGGLASGYSSLQTLLPSSLRSFWLAGLLCASLLPGWLTAESLWGTSKIAAATSELAWSRRQFARFNNLLAHDAVVKPALVLVDDTQSDPQLSYIINHPAWSADVLIARKPEGAGESTSGDTAIAELLDAFPDRNLYLFDPERFLLMSIHAR